MTIVNRAPYLRTSREFPEELHQLTVEQNKSYVDIASAVNLRTIGIFPTSTAAITGEGWYLFQNQKQQTLREVYTFTATTPIIHNIKIHSPDQFTRCWGSCTDSGKVNDYGIIWGTAVAIPGQITFYLTQTQIIFVVGAGAPTLIQGKITLEWLSDI